MTSKQMRISAICAASCVLLLCGFLLFRLLFPLVLYGTSDKILTYPAASQSYDLTYELSGQAVENGITEAQGNAYFRQAKQAYQEVFGITLYPGDRAGLSYSGNWYDGYTIQLHWVVWKDEWYDAPWSDEEWHHQGKEPYHAYDAMFQQQTALGEAVLTELSFWGDMDTGLFDDYVSEAQSLIAAELGETIPDEYSMRIRVAYLCRQDDIQITISWEPSDYDYSTTDLFSYYAVYEHCDLERGTGQIKSLMLDVISPVFKPVLFSPFERDAAIQTLRTLGETKQIRLGDVLEQKALSFLEGQSAMSITFALPDDAGRMLRFIISGNGTLLGYEYISDKE